MTDVPEQVKEAMDLPYFKYHPNPINTGAIEPATDECAVCGQARDYVYVGPIYAVESEKLRAHICPWCIADGSAHDMFDLEFTDLKAIGGEGSWDRVPPKVSEEVAFRTPGFCGWQQEQWFTHCGDAAAFLGRVGYPELLAYGPQAVAAIRKSTGPLPPETWDAFLRRLDKEGAPTAYLFRCLHCGRFGGYTDTD